MIKYGLALCITFMLLNSLFLLYMRLYYALKKNLDREKEIWILKVYLDARLLRDLDRMTKLLFSLALLFVAMLIYVSLIYRLFLVVMAVALLIDRMIGMYLWLTARSMGDD